MSTLSEIYPPPEARGYPEIKRSPDRISPEELEQLDRTVEEVNQDCPLWSTLKIHNRNVFQFGREIAAGENLSREERDQISAALKLHDAIKIKVDEAGRPAIPLLKHHELSADFARQTLIQMGKNEQFIRAVTEAIRRHMGIPFLEAMAQREGKALPAPETNVDQVVRDADILDQLGFKNVAFRLKGENFVREDQKTAAEQGITQLEAAVNSALESAETSASVLLTRVGREKGQELLEKLKTAAEQLEEFYYDLEVRDIKGKLDPDKTLVNLQAKIQELETVLPLAA